MLARTHDLAAFTSLSIVFLANPIWPLRFSTFVACILAALIGGITPDIDQPTAPFWRNLPIGKYFGRTLGKLVGGHRFITHSLLGLALFGFGVHYLLIFLGPILGEIDTGYVWWSFMIGMSSHLFMDMFTKEGIPLLLPLPWKLGFPPIRRLRITTGKAVEKLIIFPGLLLINALWLGAHYDEILAILRSIGNSH
jgi:inner membrane protein